MERPDVVALLHEGIRLQEAESGEAEQGKQGTLRGGNSGCLVRTDEGLRAIGGCPRKALLRMLGIELREQEESGQQNSKQWMFAAGHLNEDGWMHWLQRSWKAGPILREADVPTRWETSNGTPVTGRPDIVLARRQGGEAVQLVLGLELKQASSIWTVRDILQDKPKTAHLCQAGHYSMALGIPFNLMYANRVNYHVLGAHIPWVGRHFPRWGKRHSDKCDYKLGEPQDATPDSLYKNGKVKAGKQAKPAFQEIFRVLPFVHGFNLEWRDGTLFVKPSDLPETEWRESLISEEGIRAYYETAANALSTDVLPPEPVALDAFGDAAKYRDCLYCPLNSLCETYAAGQKPQRTSEWLREVRSATEGAGEVRSAKPAEVP